MGLLKQLMIFGKTRLQGLPTRVALFLWAFSRQGATGVPLFAKRAAYPDPPPVIPLPESIAAQAVYQLRYKSTEYCSWVSSGRAEMFPGIGALPEPATESHVVNRGTPVAPCRLKTQRERATRVGSPCSPVFPNIMSCLKSPITAKPRITVQ